MRHCRKVRKSSLDPRGSRISGAATAAGSEAANETGAVATKVPAVCCGCGVVTGSDMKQPSFPQCLDDVSVCVGQQGCVDAGLGLTGAAQTVTAFRRITAMRRSRRICRAVNIRKHEMHAGCHGLLHVSRLKMLQRL